MINPASMFNASANQTSGHYRRQVRAAVGRTKQRLIARYEEIAPGDSRRIRSAIAEAETLAWAMPFPHLFLPDLAEFELAKMLAPNEPAFARIQ